MCTAEKCPTFQTLFCLLLPSHSLCHFYPTINLRFLDRLAKKWPRSKFQVRTPSGFKYSDIRVIIISAKRDED